MFAAEFYKGKPINRRLSAFLQGGSMSRKISISTFKAMTFAVPLAIVLVALTGCSSKPISPESPGSTTAQKSTTAATPAQAAPNLETTDAGTAKQTTALALPKN